MPATTDKKRDDAMGVLLICALKDEYDQVLQVTDGLMEPGWNEHPGPDGWIVADGRFTTAFGISLNIRATHASHMGREQAQATAAKLMQAQPVQCLAMCGICAGRRGKVALGDVIFADRLWSYDAGKLTVENGERRFQGDMLQYRPSPLWVQRMQHLTIPANAPWLSTASGFKHHVGPIATGAAVCEDADIFARLAASMRKVLGIEMEASALGALGEIHEIPVLIAKGVSDYGDANKDDRYQTFAARAAAECLIKLLRESAELLFKPSVASAAEDDTPKTHSINPYRDLLAFREQDRHFFFGRKTATEQLIGKVDHHRFVTVLGSSGSGKSSLVQAGLIPALRERGDWEVGILRPGAEPLRSLAGCLLTLLQGEPAANDELDRLELIGKLAADWATSTAEGNVSLYHIVNRIIEKQKGVKHLLLLVDQWEELYTDKALQAAAVCFTDTLLDTVQRSPLKVVATLRADFTGYALGHPGLRDNLQQAANCMLGPMRPGELEQVIEGPADEAGVGFEPGLVERILDDMNDEPGSLPLLEFCLTRLYEARQDGLMRQTDYETIGKVQGAIVRHADAVIDAIEAQQPGRGELARDIFLQLVHLGEGSEDTRRRMFIDDLGVGKAVRPLLKQLADARLIVTGHDAGSGKDTAEVAHEALIRRWPKLRDWLEQDRADLRLLREIERAAKAWSEHGESPAYRWSDERVMEAAPTLSRLQSRFPLGENEQRFLGPLTADEMLRLLQDPAASHAERATIGDRLALQPDGDPRPGLGVNGDGLPDIVWKRLPGGEVKLELDAPDADNCFQFEPFHIALYPVTVAQWRAFLDADDGYESCVTKVRNWTPARQRGRDNQPAVDLTWIEAIAFCQWLSSRLGYEVRLPAEWEWQQAATSGNPENRYPWGVEDVDNRANTVESDLGRMVAVGLYPSGASLQQVMDLAGNVWEWCQNQYDQPKEIGEGGDAQRVLRGGSWYGNRELSRCAYRFYNHPNYRSYYVGFRVVCVSPIA